MALTHITTKSTKPLRPILGQRLKPGGGSCARRDLSFLGSNNCKANLQLAESLLTISASEFRNKWNFDPLTETPLPQGQFLWTPVKPFSKVSLKLAKTKAECDLVTCFKLPQKEVFTRQNNENSTCKSSEDIVQPVDQTCNVSDINLQPVGQTCKGLRCISVKETSCCKLNKSENTKVLSKMYTYGENNNVLALITTSRNHRQSTIADFLRASKRPESSSVSCEAPMGKSKASITEVTMLPSSPKLRKIMSDGDHS